MKRVILFVVVGAGLLLLVAGCVLNRPLDACFIAIPDPGEDPLTILFDASCSTYYGEPLGVGYIYEWQFGDGPRAREHGNAITTYTFQEPGQYRVELLIIGWGGEMARTSHRVEVGDS